MIQVRGIDFYYGQHRVLEDVSVTIQPQERIAIVGPSGCGKSTLARLMAGLIRPAKGEVNVDGRVGMVFQDPYSSFDPFWPIETALREAFIRHPKMGHEVQYRLMEEMIAQVGLPTDSLGRMPHEFSGGQRQRLAIARALLAQPSLLILDEPTSALDVIIAKDILTLVMSLQQRYALTTVLITHNLIQAQHFADRIIVMNEGKITEDPAFIKNLFDAARLIQVDNS